MHIDILPGDVTENLNIFDGRRLNTSLQPEASEVSKKPGFKVWREKTF